MARRFSATLFTVLLSLLTLAFKIQPIETLGTILLADLGEKWSLV